MPRKEPVRLLICSTTKFALSYLLLRFCEQRRRSHLRTPAASQRDRAIPTHFLSTHAALPNPTLFSPFSQSPGWAPHKLAELKDNGVREDGATATVDDANLETPACIIYQIVEPSRHHYVRTILPKISQLKKDAHGSRASSPYREDGSPTHSFTLRGAQRLCCSAAAQPSAATAILCGLAPRKTS